MYDDRDQEKTLARQREWERQDKQERDDAVKALLQHKQGRKYLYWLLSVGKAIGHNAFTGNALSTSFNCGEQNVGQQIMAHIIEVDAKGFLTTLQEQEDERADRAATE